MNTPDDIIKVQLDELWPVMQEQIESGSAVRFYPRGTSMLPMLREGIDSVLLSKAPDTLSLYDIPLYKRGTGQFVLHRIVATDGFGYTMCGDNQYVRESGVQKEQILAVVTGFYRGDELVSLDNKQYLLYVKKQVKKQFRRAKMVRTIHTLTTLFKKKKGC